MRCRRRRVYGSILVLTYNQIESNKTKRAEPLTYIHTRCDGNCIIFVAHSARYSVVSFGNGTASDSYYFIAKWKSCTLAPPTTTTYSIGNSIYRQHIQPYIHIEWQSAIAFFATDLNTNSCVSQNDFLFVVQLFVCLCRIGELSLSFCVCVCDCFVVRVREDWTKTFFRFVHFGNFRQFSSWIFWVASVSFVDFVWRHVNLWKNEIIFSFFFF